MPIKGLTDTRRLPRLGKIHLGVKVPGAGGNEYPKATDYFVCPDEVKEVYGEEPKVLDIIIPIEDDEQWCTQYYRQWSKTVGLVCKGDGIKAQRRIEDPDGTVRMVDNYVCDGRGDPLINLPPCPEYGTKCKQQMNLRFILPKVPSSAVGVYQIDTTSINAILNTNSVADILREKLGRCAGVPLILSLEVIPVQTPKGIQKKAIITYRTVGTWDDLMLAGSKSMPQLEAGVSLEIDDDDEYDDSIELIDPQNQQTSGKPEVTQPSMAGAAPPVIDEVPAHEKSPEEIANAIAGAGAASQSLMEPTTEPVDKIRAAYEALLAKENAEKAAVPGGEYNPDKDYGPTTTEAPPAAETITDWEHFFPIAFKITGEKSVTPVAKLLGLATIGLWKGTKDQALDELQKIKGTCDWRDM